MHDIKITHQKLESSSISLCYFSPLLGHKSRQCSGLQNYILLQGHKHTDINKKDQYITHDNTWPH